MAKNVQSAAHLARHRALTLRRREKLHRCLSKRGREATAFVAVAVGRIVNSQNRSRSIATRKWSLVSLAFLFGCVSVDPVQDRSTIERLLEDRGASKLGWDLNGAAGSREVLQGILARPLDREAAIHVAMLNSPRLQQVYGELGLARTDVLEAVQIANPRIGGWSLGLASGPGSQFVIGVAQPLLDLLTLPAKARLARSDYKRVRYETAAAILGVTLDVEAAWYRDVSATQVAQMRSALAEVLQTSADLAQRFYDAGNITLLQLDREKAAGTDARIAAARAQIAARMARLQLNTQLGLTGRDAMWEGSSTLPQPVAREDDPQELERLATVNNLSLLAAREGVAVAAGASNVARLFGLLGSTAVGYEREREVDGSVIRGPTLDLEVPVFNQQGARRARALASYRLARAKLATLSLETTNGVPAAAERVRILSEISTLYRNALVPQREMVAQQSQLEQNYALIGEFEVLQARGQQFEAYQGYLETLRDYWLARVDLARLIGRRLPSDTISTDAALSPREYLTRSSSPPGPGHQHHSLIDTAPSRGTPPHNPRAQAPRQEDRRASGDASGPGDNSPASTGHDHGGGGDSGGIGATVPIADGHEEDPR